MKGTKIDWCDCTLNPVIGCKNGCEYCYARKINDRFNLIKCWTEPQFFPERLKQLKSKKPKSIFMDSMSDIMWWKPEWIEETLKFVKANTQHNYIFLSKNNSLPYEFFYDQNFAESKNLFFGKSITTNKQVYFTDCYNFDFLSIEPILEDLTLDIRPETKLKQIIIGAETGNRKNKISPKKDWIDKIVEQCDKAGIRVFMKASLKDIMGTDFRQDKLIWEVRNAQ